MSNQLDDLNAPMGGSAGALEAFGVENTADEAEVDGPSLRSVKVLGNAPSVVLPPSFGSIPKPGKLVSLPKPSIGVSRESTLDVKQEWSGLTQASTWNIKGEDLDMVPEDFPLERTHRLIPGASPEIVARRISDTLRLHSIEAEFDCQNAKAKCKTSDYVSFRVRLFAGGENCDPVVVEVQRRCGSASSFMKSCRAILNAAEGNEESQVAYPKMPKLKPLTQMKCLQGVISTNSDYSQTSIDALEDVMNMLKSQQRDTNLLGMENLVSLTDPIKTCAGTALRVSRSVIFGDDKHDIREEIVALSERDVFETEDGLATHMDQLRRLALAVFANALTVCSKDGCLAPALSGQRWFWDNLAPSLIGELKLASSSANTACSASTCLNSVASCSVEGREKLRDQGIEEALVMASQYGQQNHAMLYEEASRCLKHFT